MKVTIIHCSFIYTGGGERIVLEQISHLKNSGYEVECYAPIVDYTKCFPDIIKSYNIKTFLPQLPGWFPLRHAVTLLLSCLLVPFFIFRFIKTDIFVGENQPGAWLAYILSRLLRKPYVAFLNHPNRILYPREHEDWATVSDFRFLSKLFAFVRPMLAYLDKVSIIGASERYVNGYFIGREIEKIYGCSWVACPSGTPFLTGYSQRENCEVKKIVIDKPVFSLPFSFPLSLYAHRHFAYLDHAHVTQLREDDQWGSLLGGEIENRFNLRQMAHQDTETLHMMVKNTAPVIKGFDLGQDFVLYTGRHQPWKRIDWLIEIFSLLRQNSVYLVIPGPFTTHTEELQKLAAALHMRDRIIFLGEIDQQELFALYRYAAVYAFPSEREDFGIVVIEAMGQGLPVVAWNVGGPTDTVEDGVTGYLVEGYDKKQYAQRLAELLDNPALRERMGRAGIERVREKFSWQSHLQVLSGAFSQAID